MTDKKEYIIVKVPLYMDFFDQNKIEEEYQHRNCLWGLEANRYVKKLPDLIDSGRVLDIGVGEGRNAIYLAEKGFDVTGVDVLKVAIDKFSKIAKEKGLEVTAEVADAAAYEIKGEYGAIICTATMHYFTEDEAKKVISRMKEHTQPNGVNIITAFTKEDVGFGEYPDFYFVDSADELKKMYSDWEIIQAEDYIKHDTHDKPHDHHIAVIIAKKHG